MSCGTCIWTKHVLAQTPPGLWTQQFIWATFWRRGYLRFISQKVSLMAKRLFEWNAVNDQGVRVWPVVCSNAQSPWTARSCFSRRLLWRSSLTTVPFWVLLPKICLEAHLLPVGFNPYKYRSECWVEQSFQSPVILFFPKYYTSLNWFRKTIIWVCHYFETILHIRRIYFAAPALVYLKRRHCHWQQWT